jgi:hypothetical protein
MRLTKRGLEAVPSLTSSMSAARCSPVLAGSDQADGARCISRSWGQSDHMADASESAFALWIDRVMHTRWEHVLTLQMRSVARRGAPRQLAPRRADSTER